MRLMDYLKDLYDKHLYHQRYKKALKLDKKSYEDYLCDYYALMMDRCEFSKGLTLDFSNPKRFSEKIQWLKLYDQDIRKGIYSDKYLVRKHIKETIGEKYLNDLLTIDGKDVFYNANEIDFNKLPNSFVLKCTHASHFNFIVKDKEHLTKNEIKTMVRQLNKWLKIRYAFVNGLELQYENTKPAIIIEKYLSINDDLPDYKFFCFGGKIVFAWIDEGRYGSKHWRTIFDPYDSSKVFSFKIGNFEAKKTVILPENYPEMLAIAEQLCEDFPFVRVDLYNVDGKIIFGELTFTSGSGLRCIDPVEADYELGNYIKIDQTSRKDNWEYRKK